MSTAVPTSVAAIPDAPSSEALQRVLDACAGDRSGDVAADVPQLEGADPDHFGVCIATSEGEFLEVGDSRAPFCLQSIAKAFTYAIALHDAGEEEVDCRIDLEPSGEAYDDISLNPETGHPSNPLINAGAIVSASLVAGDDPDAQVGRILDVYEALAHRRLETDEAVLDAELSDPWRNRGIANLLREYRILEGDPDGPVRVHAAQSAVVADCRDLARMGATLACGGVQPCTGERLFAEPVVRRVLSVMGTCGMYDDTGAWMARVGLPAKSGVGGAILAIVPGRMGLAVYSPRLDAHGASVRGGAALRELSEDLGLHVMRTAATS